MQIYLGCIKCYERGEYDIGQSSWYPFPIRASLGEVINSGGAFDWMKEHHNKYGHNKHYVFTEEGNIIGEAGFGRENGWVFERTTPIQREFE